MVSLNIDNVKLMDEFDSYFEMVYYDGGFSYLIGARYNFNAYTMEKCTLDHFNGIDD